MKAMIQVSAFGPPMSIDDLGVVRIGMPPSPPTDPDYEYRTIALDAERAWKMQEPLHRALSWPKGSRQERWWLGAYYAARDAS